MIVGMDQTTAGNPLVSDAPEAGVSASKGGSAFVGRPRQRARGLAHGLVEDLGEKIRSQVLRPGDKLPTESAIMQAYGVSRTVVREALSKLQAGGLVETLHGVGTFVLQPRPGGVFRLEPGEIATSVDVLAVLELRISLETESAGLAASRRTEEQLVAMRQALDDFEHNVTVSGDTVAPDFRFHLQIAQSTGNPYFAAAWQRWQREDGSGPPTRRRGGARAARRRLQTRGCGAELNYATTRSPLCASNQLACSPRTASPTLSPGRTLSCGKVRTVTRPAAVWTTT